MKFAVLKQLPLSHKNIFRSYSKERPIDLNDYVSTWCTEVDPTTDNYVICEQLFTLFNTDRPKHFAGHSLSTSDIIQIIDDEASKTTNYYCDTIGWKELTDMED